MHEHPTLKQVVNHDFEDLFKAQKIERSHDNDLVSQHGTSLDNRNLFYQDFPYR